MSELINAVCDAKKGKVVFLMENILEIGINHRDGYTTLYLDIQDMPADLRQRIINMDEDTLDQLEAYFDDYYSDAELDGVSLVRGEGWDNLHRWKEIFLCCGTFRSFIVKVKGMLIRLINNI